MKCQWKDCVVETGSNAQLSRHVNGEHVKGSSKFECFWRLCSSFGVAQKDLRELELHCNGHCNYQPYWCMIPECDEKYSRPESLVNHCRREHGIEIEPVVGGSDLTEVYLYRYHGDEQDAESQKKQAEIGGTLEQLEERLSWAKELEQEVMDEYRTVQKQFEKQVRYREKTFDKLLQHELGDEAKQLCS